MDKASDLFKVLPKTGEIGKESKMTTKTMMKNALSNTKGGASLCRKREVRSESRSQTTTKKNPNNR